MALIKKNIAILGSGNIGTALAEGIISNRVAKINNLVLTRRNKKKLKILCEKGFNAISNNLEAVSNADIILLTVTPQNLNVLLEEIKNSLTSKQIIISVIPGVSIKQIKEKLGNKNTVIRVMPNTAIAIGESMTCIATDDNGSKAFEITEKIFNTVGKTIRIPEELMSPATALCACGTAFFLRAIRAASQGGIEIGFHSEEALLMAAQTAKGAAAMLLKEEKHPEREIDKVTTPQGITIAGLNQMEHFGFSSSMIKGIVTAAEKAEKIYSSEK